MVKRIKSVYENLHDVGKFSKKIDKCDLHEQPDDEEQSSVNQCP